MSEHEKCRCGHQRSEHSPCGNHGKLECEALVKRDGIFQYCGCLNYKHGVKERDDAH